MRLVKIKLAGFKSFVDPTVLELTSPLVAVVGPNGCGKSNIIDAIRWVMGERSAQKLRGESSDDVIFNGSSGRKPVGQASVELVFDNSAGSLGGEYAGFSEISIRRQISRDDQSSYFLNGVRCRRRDITDIFLGTGLGPRSYAIIEQGMISRVIEAKPEELRAFLEEAAGISLYRKRRQETETRMRHTRENLERLQDILQELEKQLERLKRQSESALKYQEYKKVLDVLETETATLRWRTLHIQLEEFQKEIRIVTNELEEQLAQRTHVELELEKHRTTLDEQTDKFNLVQAEFYDIGSHIARTEQTLENYKTRAQELKEELLQNEQNLSGIQFQITQDKERLQNLNEALLELEPQLLQLVDKQQQYAKILSQAEENMRLWNEGFEQLNQAAAIPNRASEVEKARIEQLEKQAREAGLTIQRLDQENLEWDMDKLKEALQLLEAQAASKESECRTEQQHLEEMTQKITELRSELTTATQHFDATKTQSQNQNGRLVSLQALQQAALGKIDKQTEKWLNEIGLNSQTRLGENIKVEPGYERAVETVLGQALQAVCVSDLNSLSSSLNSFESGTLFLVDNHRQDEVNNSKQSEFLMSKIQASCTLPTMLSSVYVVSHLSEALKLRETLKPLESVVTQDGIWIGPNWMKVHKNLEENNGILERSTEIEQLQLELNKLSETMGELAVKIEHYKQSIQELESERDVLYQKHQRETNQLKEVTGKMSGASARLEHARIRVVKIQEEKNMQKQKLKEAQEDISQARFNLQKALDEMQAFAIRREALLQERNKLKDILQQATQESRQASTASHQMALKVEGLKAQVVAVTEGLERLAVQQSQSDKQQVRLQEALTEANNPQAALKKTLEDLLMQRLAVENRLNTERNLVEEIQQALKSFEKQRGHLEQSALELRTKIETKRIECQGMEVRAETFKEKLATYQVTPEEVLKTLSEEAEETVWAQKLEDMTRKIERLGAINLAAIEEYQSESERKNYLEAQNKDLAEALETLENAIRKIDRETRAKFKETFDKVNESFQNLFPRLFVGGQAYLELEGEDLLEAGVSVMARPPGKRNSSIHLLSGGEKALTAVALVFSIFQLNPAPFCMLDEVDAPLDDANVGRFCELVKHMSETVQFIFVTHNKLAMDMAHHLIGVTMKEPGVSRLVSVDVEKAYEMATA